MASPNPRPGAFLLEVAAIGRELNKSFTTFITYRKVQDRRLENLYATLNITTGTLNDLGTLLNEHESHYRLKEDVTRSVTETCKKNFELLLTMVNEGITEGGVWKGDGTIGGHTVTTEVDPWLLITLAVGGREEAKAYWKSLDDTRDTLVELNHFVKYMVLKSAEEKAVLTSEQEAELKKVRNFLPRLVQTHETVEKFKKIEADELAAVEARRKRLEERPALTRVDSIAESDITLMAEERRIRSPPPVIIKDVDMDARSVSSWCSSSSGSDISSEEIYEEWTLRWNEPFKAVNRSRGFLGLTFNSYHVEQGFWGTDPEFRTVEEMKEQEKFAAADKSPAKHKEAMQKILQALPKKGGIAIDHLLDERTQASSHQDAKREWSVVAVRPTQKFPYGSAKKWGKDPKTTDWLVTIKGITIDTKDRSRSFRRDDPWRKRSRSPYPSRFRSRSPPRRRHYPNPVVSVRDRHSDRPPFPRPLFMPRNPVRSLPPRETFIEDGFVQGKIVVGKIMTKNEAEEKMTAIWDEMIVKAAEKPTEEAKVAEKTE